MVLITRLAKQVYRRSSDELLGMQLRHLVALSYVRDHDACPQHELAEAFCMDANNVVLLLNELEQQGYATRLRDPDDRRRHVVELTPAGAEALGLAEHAQEAIEDDVLKALDAEERATLWQLLTRALSGAEQDQHERLQRHHGVDLDLSALRQLRHADRHARRGIVREEARVHLVDLREGRQVGHVDRQPHRFRQRCSRRRADLAEVLQATARLRRGRFPHELAADRVERDLA